MVGEEVVAVEGKGVLPSAGVSPTDYGSCLSESNTSAGYRGPTRRTNWLEDSEELMVAASMAWIANLTALDIDFYAPLVVALERWVLALQRRRTHLAGCHVAALGHLPLASGPGVKRLALDDMRAPSVGLGPGCQCWRTAL